MGAVLKLNMSRAEEMLKKAARNLTRDPVELFGNVDAIVEWLYKELTIAQCTEFSEAWLAKTKCIEDVDPDCYRDHVPIADAAIIADTHLEKDRVRELADVHFDVVCDSGETLDADHLSHLIDTLKTNGYEVEKKG